jgi:glutathione S-transferase
MLKILGRATSANVQKVVWLCDEIDLPFERENIGGPFGGNDKPEYLALNPNGRVPTVIDDGFVIWESNACVQYLGSIHAVGTWYPTDLKARGRCCQWMDWALGTLAPAHGPVFQGLIRTPEDKRDAGAIARGRDGWSKNMAMLDGHLANNAFIAGDAITMGDMPVAILSFRWFNLDIEREDYPNLKRWYDEIVPRRAFKKHVIDIGLA